MTLAAGGQYDCQELMLFTRMYKLVRRDLGAAVARARWALLYRIRIAISSAWRPAKLRACLAVEVWTSHAEFGAPIARNLSTSPKAGPLCPAVVSE